MTARDDAAQSPARGRYIITLEGPDTRRVTRYATRAEAVLAIEREVDTFQATGATVAGDLSSGYVARWWEGGHLASMRITLGQRQ